MILYLFVGLLLLQDSELERQERKKVFPRVTLQVVDAPRREVLAELGRQSGWAWDMSDAAPEEQATLKAADLPMSEALDRIGVKWWFNVSGKVHLQQEKRTPEEVAAFDDGMRFLFSRRAWKPDGKATGTIFETDLKLSFDGEVRWSVASVKTDQEWAVETCALHSPRRVYVPSPDLESPRVTIKGTRLWYCPTPVEFKLPKDGDTHRIGTGQVTIEGTSIRVRLDNALEEPWIKRTLTEKDIVVTFKPGRVPDTMGVGAGGGGGGRFGGSYGGKNRAWCGCLGEPATKNPKAPPMVKELLVKIPYGGLYPLSDMASISLIYHKPVEESFELTSPPLK